MDPITLIALATAAGFVFNKMTGQTGKEERREFTFSKDLVARLKPDTRSEFDLSSLEVLPEYGLIKTLVDYRFPIIFVTGGAGTGKSTFIRWALNEFPGAVLLGAPTAMSAVNIGGKTLHSLCRLPPGWITKDDIKRVNRREIQEAKLLIIDEMSMVTANLLDGVSGFLRLNRRIDKPFGGLPVILVGDMFQLPPVIGDSVRPLYEKIYGSPRFYNARCLEQSTYYAVELKRTYRQSDQHLVDMLARLREGVDLEETIENFNDCCPITSTPREGAVWLSPRNAEVEARNQRELGKIRGMAKTYRGIVDGDFKNDRFPSPFELTLKLGAQIMFTRNDDAGRWVSGTVGRVARMLTDKIFVELPDSSSRLVDVGRATWKEYRYDWNRRRNTIERTVVGNYRQFPLLPAWSMTIHKSQGKTIERVHLDLGDGAFETGQTYVALSRCRSMQGLSMSRPLRTEDILVDHESKKFYEHLRGIIDKLPPHAILGTLQEGK